MSHAYGGASDIPQLIKQLKTAPPPKDEKSEPWFSLWSSLCYQNDVYTASYAAIPHIVAVAESKPVKHRLEFFSFIGAIEAYRHRKGAPPIPPFLEEGYFSAIEQAAGLIRESLVADWDEEEMIVLLGAYSITRGHHRLGNAIIFLPEESTCPECDAPVPLLGYDLDEI
ncbi:MAG: hypothetical protein MOB07_02420 [Acidobacteria bacterium]|nr:hypothetical protein [Acidobacteriota bacterium]